MKLSIIAAVVVLALAHGKTKALMTLLWCRKHLRFSSVFFNLFQIIRNICRWVGRPFEGRPCQNVQRLQRHYQQPWSQKPSSVSSVDLRKAGKSLSSTFRMTDIKDRFHERRLSYNLSRSCSQKGQTRRITFNWIQRFKWKSSQLHLFWSDKCLFKIKCPETRMKINDCGKTPRNRQRSLRHFSLTL